MKLGTIVSRAASAYPDAYVLQFFDLNRDCAVANRAGGDGLAEFIAWELYETFDPEVSDDEQLQTAIENMRSAQQALYSVATALENLARERSEAA